MFVALAEFHNQNITEHYSSCKIMERKKDNIWIAFLGYKTHTRGIEHIEREHKKHGENTKPEILSPSLIK